MRKFKSITYGLLEELGEEHRLGCKCCRFSQGVDLPIPRKLTLDETQRAARGFSASLFKDWTSLNALLKRFELVVQRRWMKKNIKQRREVLLSAWPGMSSTHRPDFSNFRELDKQAAREKTCRSEAFLWPYINLEDLQQRHFLLLFLKSRGRHLPETFRHADVKAAHLGDSWLPDLDLQTEACLEGYCCADHYVEDHTDNEPHRMLFDKKHSPNGHGVVLDCLSVRLKPGQHKYLSRCQEGLLGLEIQQGIYSFLLRCTKLILHDIEPSMYFLAPHQPEPSPTQLAKSNEWASLAGHTLQAPYCIPQRLDLQRLRVLASVRRSAAEDHVWMLREDPGFFMSTLREWLEHNGSCGCSTSCASSACWNREAGNMATNAFVSFVLWDDIYRKLKAMPDIEIQMQRADQEHVRLSTIDEDMWIALMDIFSNAVMFSIDVLRDGVPSSPRLRGRYYWRTVKEGQGRWELKKGAPPPVRRVDQLFYAIFTPSQRSLHGLNGLIQEVQYMLDTESEAAYYFDGWIEQHFSDLALLSELQHSVDSLAPWFDKNKASRVTDQADKFISRTRQLTAKLHFALPLTCANLAMTWDPAETASFVYPIDKAANKVNVDQMRVAERCLDKFWRQVQQGVTSMVKISLEKVLANRAFERRHIYRTPQWVQLPTPEHTPPRPTVTTILPGGSLQHSTESTEGADTTPTKGKLKVKTRGQPAVPDPRMIVADNAVAPDKTKLSKKAFKVFCALLPSPGDVTQQKCEMGWDELLSAFDFIGLEPEKLHGSSWIFKPRPNVRCKVELGRSIQFHEPKEVRRGGKIPRPTVRMFGRRLKHAYGWTYAEDMFECE